MSIARGVDVATLCEEVAAGRIADPRHVTWPLSSLVSFLNEGIDHLANEHLFARTEVFPAVASQMEYTLSCEISRVESVMFGSFQLVCKTKSEIDAIYAGTDWRNLTGDPKYYYVTETGVGIVPAPGSGGSALTFGAAPITEAAGSTITGAGYYAANNAGTTQHWLPGDGTVTGFPGGSLHLVVEYSFLPRDSGQDDSVPLRYRKALSTYVAMAALGSSDDPEERGKADSLEPRWEEAVEKLNRRAADGFRSAEYIPTAKATKEF